MEAGFRARSCSINSFSFQGNPHMNMQDRQNTFDLDKYGVGQPVRRTEDPVLVQGHGRYTDDLSLPGQAYAVFVRSRNGHGTIKGIDTAAAKAMPGGSEERRVGKECRSRWSPYH